MTEFELTLDREHIRQLLLRSDFYAACPEFAHLQECAAAVRKAAMAKCIQCEGDWVVYRNLIDAFFLRARLLSTANDTPAIGRLKDYLATKKGYRPAVVVLYYRQNGKTARLRL